MSTKIKYLKDENGEVFSPIVDSDSIIMRDNSTLKENIFPIIHINKKVRVTSNNGWVDTGITTNSIKYNGISLDNEIPETKTHGAYAVMLTINQNNGTNGDRSYSGHGNLWGETGVGMMALYTGSTNSFNANEIPLSWLGHAPNDQTVKLRWIRAGNNGNAKLQITCNLAWANDCNLNFYFRKII